MTGQSEVKAAVGHLRRFVRGTVTGSDEDQICRIVKDYPALKGAENSQKAKQVKARGLPRG